MSNVNRVELLIDGIVVNDMFSAMNPNAFSDDTGRRLLKIAEHVLEIAEKEKLDDITIEDEMLSLIEHYEKKYDI